MLHQSVFFDEGLHVHSFTVMMLMTNNCKDGGDDVDDDIDDYIDDDIDVDVDVDVVDDDDDGAWWCMLHDVWRTPMFQPIPGVLSYGICWARFVGLDWKTKAQQDASRSIPSQVTQKGDVDKTCRYCTKVWICTLYVF